MTFEEFFHKKKIDLAQLQQAEAALFYEFKSHFAAMGEKSFDHSKKFWFNKLRRLYHIIEEPKAEKVKIEINQIASQAEPLSSPVPERKTSFTPRFKAKPATSQVEPSLPPEPIEEPEIEESSKPAFKPRFRALVTKADTSEESKPDTPIKTEAGNIELIDSEIPKPAFKPRFKPSMVKPAASVPESNQEEVQVEPISEEPKPNIGFKPRFKAQVTKPQTESSSEKTEIKQDETPEKQSATESTPQLGFKARFKAGITSSKVEEPQKPETENKTALTPEAEKALTLGLKPRFKAQPETEKVTIEPDIVENSSPAVEADAKPELAPKLGFKPRFKTQTPQQIEKTGESKEAKSVDSSLTEQISSIENPSTDPSNLSAKPKFTPRNFKPQPKEENL